MVHGRCAGERGALSPGAPPPMRVIDPASGNTLAEVAEADAPAVADAFRRARRAQPAGAATPPEVRRDAGRRFRALVVGRTEALAPALTREVGEPVQPSPRGPARPAGP